MSLVSVRTGRRVRHHVINARLGLGCLVRGMMRGISEEGQGSMTIRIEGRFAGELERRWHTAYQIRRHPLRLDLCQVAEIDDAGKELLKEMFSQGVEFVVAPHQTTQRIV